MTSKVSKKKKALDPLFQLFEHHLVTRSYEDAATFTKQLAKDYLAYLDSTLAHVPLHLRAGVLEDLEQECHEMLVKKMYGMTSPADYQNTGMVTENRGETLKVINLREVYNSDDQAKE